MSHRKTRSGATVLAVLIVLSIVCMLAHQTTRTLFIMRQGQEYARKISQAQEVLELGRKLERRYRDEHERLTAAPIIVQLGQEYAKLDFASESQLFRISAIWPVDSQGAELPNRLPISVSWEESVQ